MMQPDIIKGQLFIFTSGAYDSYGIDEIVIALKDLYINNLIKEYYLFTISTIQIPLEYYASEGRDFIIWLAANNYVIAVKTTEIYLGKYELTDCHSIEKSQSRLENFYINSNIDRDFKINSIELNLRYFIKELS